LARPRPAAPSRRVYAAFTIAAIIGVAVFLIWWLTSDARLRRSADAARRAETESAPAQIGPALSREALIESALPRGGSLAGWTDAMPLTLDRITGAPLVRVNRSTDAVEPWLAESWIASDDHLTYTVKLRPGLTSAGGTPLTSDAVIVALGPLAVMGQPVAVRALDPLTLELRFAAPFAPAMRMLDRHPIAGFGPFVEAPPDRKRSGPPAFRRNPNYWRKSADGSQLPYLDEIVLADEASGAKEQDFADSAIAAEDFEALKKAEQSGKLRLFELGPGLDADALWFGPPEDLSRRSGTTVEAGKADAAKTDLSRRSGAASDAAKADRPWLTSETLRLAISAAVDRRAYCKQVFYGACDPMAGPVSPANIAWFNPDFPLGQANPELARAMLAELGLRDRNGDGILEDAALRPLRFMLLIRGDVASSARAATFLAGTMKAIGVLMDVTPLSASALAARRQKGAYEAIYDRIDVSDTDPAMNLDFWLSSGAAHVWNPTRSAPPADWERQGDQLMMKNASTFDRVERLQAFVDAQKLYLQHMPAIFFGAPYVRITTSMRTLNATPSPLRPHLLWNADSLAALK